MFQFQLLKCIIQSKHIEHRIGTGQFDLLIVATILQSFPVTCLFIKIRRIASAAAVKK